MSEIQDLRDSVFLSGFLRRERSIVEKVVDKLEDLQREIEALKAAQQQQPKAEPVAEPAKPTPGEWYYGAMAQQIRVSGGLDYIAHVFCLEGESQDVIAANGRLMAASKRMYELLTCVGKNIVLGFGTPDLESKIDAIIKEVEGR